mmetsp:Transcript_3922/g.14580  ORF Transcript_3922/g.14580 Transcript_3922/m.14580 type:complete len:253 (+) Transcript_3922:573-1331(+)
MTSLGRIGAGALPVVSGRPREYRWPLKARNIHTSRDDWYMPLVMGRMAAPKHVHCPCSWSLSSLKVQPYLPPPRKPTSTTAQSPAPPSADARRPSSKTRVCRVLISASKTAAAHAASRPRIAANAREVSAADEGEPRPSSRNAAPSGCATLTVTCSCMTAACTSSVDMKRLRRGTVCTRCRTISATVSWLCGFRLTQVRMSSSTASCTAGGTPSATSSSTPSIARCSMTRASRPPVPTQLCTPGSAHASTSA